MKRTSRTAVSSALSYGRLAVSITGASAPKNIQFKRVVFRLDWLKAHKCLPYVMRDEACYASESNGFYADVAAYANQPAFFRKIDFRDYMPIRWPGNSKRVKEMADKWDHARAQSIHYTEEKKKIEHTN